MGERWDRFTASMGRGLSRMGFKSRTESHFERLAECDGRLKDGSIEERRLTGALASAEKRRKDLDSALIKIATLPENDRKARQGEADELRRDRAGAEALEAELRSKLQDQKDAIAKDRNRRNELINLLKGFGAGDQLREYEDNKKRSDAAEPTQKTGAPQPIVMGAAKDSTASDSLMNHYNERFKGEGVHKDPSGLKPPVFNFASQEEARAFFKNAAASGQTFNMVNMLTGEPAFRTDPTSGEFQEYHNGQWGAPLDVEAQKAQPKQEVASNQEAASNNEAVMGLGSGGEQSQPDPALAGQQERVAENAQAQVNRATAPPLSTDELVQLKADLDEMLREIKETDFQKISLENLAVTIAKLEGSRPEVGVEHLNLLEEAIGEFKAIEGQVIQAQAKPETVLPAQGTEEKSLLQTADAAEEHGDNLSGVGGEDAEPTPTTNEEMMLRGEASQPAQLPAFQQAADSALSLQQKDREPKKASQALLDSLNPRKKNEQSAAASDQTETSTRGHKEPKKVDMRDYERFRGGSEEAKALARRKTATAIYDKLREVGDEKKSESGAEAPGPVKP